MTMDHTAPAPRQTPPVFTAPALSRLPDAADRLQHLLLQRHARGFLWGWRDCALWAADCTRAVTGRDPAADLRGTYYSGLQAARVIKAAGGLHALAAARIGPPIQPHQALDGDVALVPPQHTSGSLVGNGALAVYWRGALIAQGNVGLVVLRPDVARLWWRSAQAWSRRPVGQGGAA